MIVTVTKLLWMRQDHLSWEKDVECIDRFDDKN